MRKKCLTTSTGDDILIFDDVFEVSLIGRFQEFAEQSFYTLTCAALPFLHKRDETSMRCMFTPDDLQRFGILDTFAFQEISKYIVNKNAPIKNWIVLSDQSSNYSFHSDVFKHPGVSKKEAGQTLLYFINTEWDKNWGSEILFCNDVGELEVAVSCTPNRIVLFDSVIPHRSTLISPKAPSYNLIFVSQFLL